jgi:hypothetical protein
MRYSAVVTLAVLAVASQARAEGPERRSGGYLSGGLGVGGEGVAGLLSLGIREGNHLFTVRGAQTQEFDIFGPRPSRERSDVSVLYGRLAPSDDGFVSLSAGPGVVHRVDRGERLAGTGGFLSSSRHERLSDTTVGLALSAKAQYSARHVGLGLEVFGNVNAKASFAGLALTLDVGKLR